MTPPSWTEHLLRVAALVLLVLSLAAAMPGCGGNGNKSLSLKELQEEKLKGGDHNQQESLSGPGFPVTATKNTTRVAGADPVQDAAAVARAVYPAHSKRDRPDAVVLVDRNNWAAATAAAVLMHAPTSAPILFTDGDQIPTPTLQTLAALNPKGLSKAENAQVIRIGSVPAPEKIRGVVIAGGNLFELAAAIDAFAAATAGSQSKSVMVANADRPAFVLPAAAWSAKSGDPLLFVAKNRVPKATAAALARHDRPSVFLLGPDGAVSKRVLDRLKRLSSSVKQIGSSGPVTSAIAFARFKKDDFGWGIIDPGHGLVFINKSRPLDAAAAAPLSASGTFGPQLVINRPDHLPKPLSSYLLDIQPGYRKDPARGVYNHAWIVGNSDAISPTVQAQIDGLLEIQQIEELDKTSLP